MDLWISYGLPFKGYPPNIKMDEPSLRAMKAACATADESVSRRWIRHAWDIEGYKLQALFVQSLQKRSDMVQNILLIQAKGEVGEVFTDEDLRDTRSLLHTAAAALQLNIPINVKFAA
jgi:hypothetical protein